MSDALVVIVGAGPAGLVLGFVLRRAGVPFTIVERRTREQIGGPPKAGSIDYRTVELLTREGISPDVVEFTVRNGVCEFRTPDERVVVDYGALTGGRPHFILPQQILVETLCSAAVAARFDLRFETAVEHAEVQPGGRPMLAIVDRDGGRHELTPHLLVGCDGARSAIAPLVDTPRHEYAPPTRWLAMIGDTPAIVPHTVYASHPEGFAGQMRRTPTQTRFYLEIDDDPDDWSGDRARVALATRLGFGGALDGVHIGDFSLVDLKVRMLECMQHGDVFLAGDAAHVISPFGGKGMNLAIADAVELGHGIASYVVGSDRNRLDAYSATRLPVVWRTQAFSNWLMRMVLARAAATPDAPMFGHHLGRGWVSALQTDPLLARWFAHAYAGADPISEG